MMVTWVAKIFFAKNQFIINKFSLFSRTPSLSVVVEDEHVGNHMGNSKSMDSINSYDVSRADGLDDGSDQGDDIEKARLISQVLELQNTLDDLNQRVDGVKEENLRLRSENMVLGQYIGELLRRFLSCNCCFIIFLHF
jgi:hypothetical protein